MNVREVEFEKGMSALRELNHTVEDLDIVRKFTDKSAEEQRKEYNSLTDLQKKLWEIGLRCSVNVNCSK
jgi:hypothetical protein